MSINYISCEHRLHRFSRFPFIRRSIVSDRLSPFLPPSNIQLLLSSLNLLRVCSPAVASLLSPSCILSHLLHPLRSRLGGHPQEFSPVPTPTNDASAAIVQLPPDFRPIIQLLCASPIRHLLSPTRPETRAQAHGKQAYTWILVY